MKTEVISFYIKAPSDELVELLKIGEHVNIKVLKKTGENLYSIKLKGKELEALSNIKFPRNSTAILRVESLKPRVTLRLIGIKPSRKPQITIPADKEANEIIKSIVETLKHLEPITKSPEASAQTTTIFLPISIVLLPNQSHETELLVSSEAKKTKRGKELFRITIIAGPFKWGRVKINALSVDEKTRLVISTYSTEGYELLSKHINEISSISNIRLTFIHLAMEEPLFKKRVDIRI